MPTRSPAEKMSKFPNRSGAFALAFLLLAPGALFAQSSPAKTAPQKAAPAKSATEEKDVRAVVEDYLHGLKFNDVPSFQRAFWADAKLLFLNRDQSLGQLSQADWYKGFAASAGKEEQGDLKITSVDITGDIASVKVTETYAKSIYVDYLNMLRVKGKWMIVNKVYTEIPR